MFKGKGNGTSTSGRAQAQGRAELHRQVAGRLGYWRLFLEAKQQELAERRNPAGLPETSVVARARPAPVERAGAARTRGTPIRPVEELPNETMPSTTPAVERPPMDAGALLLDGEEA